MERLAEKLYSWASILDEPTRQQALRTASMPFIFPHLALMPDAHLGKGATVGSVIPTEGAIIPAAVGVDIGCGMIAIRTQWTPDDLRGPLGRLRAAIEKVIPLSAGHHNKVVHASYTRQRIADLEATDGIDSACQLKRAWYLELGSLGSGNHFIEISVDEHDRVWAFLHSGSRGIGNKLASLHIKTAQAFCQKWHVRLPDRDLAYLREDTPEFAGYIRDLRWAQKFALLNREEMMSRVLDCLAEYVGTPVFARETINCHHNYTEQEEHFGRRVWLSRKGAIAAHEGVRGLIPGSMGTRSYAVTGKGNTLALCSSPHGAGREYSRSAARKTFSMTELEAAMRGIEWRRTSAFLDEIPAAYKPIDTVMADARELVSVDHELRQIVNVKGD
jgi:tRNA-splicing ligase RtcB (3'-phosphate/5'-hydroxy nucleic acid ligase)